MQQADSISNYYHKFRLSTFIITYKCQISCPMCFFGGGPHRNETLPEALAMSILDESKYLQIPAIGIAGGDPFLNIDLMRELIKKAASYGMMIIVVTNAHWATSEAAAIRSLSGLRDLGLKRLQISLDDTHQQFIPIQRVAHAVKAAKQLKFEDIKLLGTSIGNSDNFKYHLFYVQEILGVSTTNIDIIDRPRTSHRYYEDRLQIRYSFEDLEHSDALGLPVKKPGDCLSEMMLDVNGDIYPCCNNFVGRIGNAYLHNLRDIMKYLHMNSYFRILKKEGPFALAKYLDNTRDTGFSKQKYGNWCELCARVFQNDQFRDLLFIHHQALSATGQSGNRNIIGKK